ncbi:MAG: hypothetical protein E7254_01585 [Lachnospiraceae bacterium]|nr:hypothetical protein [Lachnospiraceae bacterium]
MRNMKKFIIGMTVMSMMASVATPVTTPFIPMAATNVLAEVVNQGRCGDDVYYQFDNETHTLTLSGKGGTWDLYPIKINNDWENPIKIVIENGVTTIGNSLFSYCSNISSVKMADTVTTIKSNNFDRVEGTIEIPASVKKVESNAFNGAEKIVFMGDVVGYESGALTWSDSGSGDYDIGEVSLNGSADDLGKALYGASVNAITLSKENKKCTVKNGCLTTADGKGLYLLIQQGGSKMTISDDVETIYPFAFADSELSRVKLGKNVKTIGDFAFAGSSYLNEVKLNKNLSKIGTKAFDGCYELKTLDIPGKVKMGVGAVRKNATIENTNKFKYSQTILSTAKFAKKKIRLEFAKIKGASGYEIVIKRGKKSYKYTTTKNIFKKAMPSKLTKNYDVEMSYSCIGDEYLKTFDDSATVKVRPYKIVKKGKKTKKAYGMWSAKMIISDK